jgi:hypothetical protein
MLCGAPNSLLELTKFLEPGILRSVHGETSCVQL